MMLMIDDDGKFNTQEALRTVRVSKFWFLELVALPYGARCTRFLVEEGSKSFASIEIDLLVLFLPYGVNLWRRPLLRGCRNL